VKRRGAAGAHAALMANPSTNELRVELSAELDRHALEALRLEIERLARRYGIEIAEIRVDKRREARSA